jgi:hypothetical protein
MENSDSISPAEHVKTAIAQMDLVMLATLLDDDSSYFELSKKSFLQKLEVIFKNLQYNGDFEFQPFPGYCDAMLCNRGCGGYAFYAPNSHEKFIARVFENEDKSVELQSCCNFYTGKDFLSDANEIHVSVGTDEKFDFKPSEFYLALAEQCLEALSEFNDNEEQIVEAETIRIWVEAYEDLNKRTHKYGFGYHAFEDFQDLFAAFEPLYKFIINPEIINQALCEYLLEGMDELEGSEVLENWRNKYSSYCADFCWFGYDPKDTNLNYIPLGERYPFILLDHKEFAPLHRFLHFYFDIKGSDFGNENNVDSFGRE